jgi:hypothetical protein
MPHHGAAHTHLVVRLRMLSDLRKVLFPDTLPFVCRVCFTVQEDEAYHDRCLCDVAAWVPLDAVLHELSLQIRTLQEEHRTTCGGDRVVTVTCDKVA